MGRLNNKISIITGAAQGIGRAMAEIFAGEGSKVALIDRNISKLEETRGEILHEMPEASLLSLDCDITDADGISRAVEECEKVLGVPNVLINNAGINMFRAPLEMSREEWDKCISNDLTGAWHFSRAVLPGMIEKRDGSIVNISSVHGHKIIPGCFPYPVAKHGLLGLTKALGIEYAQYNVRVNSISPGLIETPMSADWYQLMVDRGVAEDIGSFKKMQMEVLPCKRLGTPKEVSMVALMLASDEAGFINATDILIDGGRSALYHEALY